MKNIKRIVPFLALAVLIVGCVSAGRTYYNTLASVQVATTAAFNGYIDLVVTGKVSTNAVPTISRDFNIFQTVWGGAVSVAQLNTNGLAPSVVTDTAAKVVNDITAAKAAK
jgi:PBP1b-binding outer membrane lipoprotein LpoB